MMNIQRLLIFPTVNQQYRLLILHGKYNYHAANPGKKQHSPLFYPKGQKFFLPFCNPLL